MEFRLGNQQRHSLVAVAMIAAATLIGLVLFDQRGADQGDPLAGLTETAETVVLGPARDDDEDGPGRSSSRFGVADDADNAETDNEATKTLATLRRSSATTRSAIRSTSPTTISTTTAPPTTASTTTSTVTTTATTSTTTSVVTTSSTSTTVVTTTTKKNKCRGKNPKCDDSRRGSED